ncbi:hypothetical protein JCM6882_003103 [Rhodosporidiobolus microsporus]
MPDSPATPPADASPVLALSTDLWLLIFEDEGLQYDDYKRLKRVCKSFYELEKSHSLDDRLFRSPPPIQPVEKGDTIRFHPAFDELDLVCSTVEDAFADRYYGKEETPDVFALPVMKEFATSPACRRVYVPMGGEALAENPSGVTVEDVLHACAEMWRSQPDGETCAWIARLERIDPSKVTCRDMLVDHCFYEGMLPASVLREDFVSLNVRPFGS